MAIAASGLRISLGSWHSAADLEALVQALKMALKAAGNQYPAAARNGVACIKYVPAVFEKHLQPGGEIHGYLASGDAEQGAIEEGVAGDLLWGHRLEVKTDLLGHPVADRLHR